MLLIGSKKKRELSLSYGCRYMCDVKKFNEDLFSLGQCQRSRMSGLFVHGAAVLNFESRTT